MSECKLRHRTLTWNMEEDFCNFTKTGILTVAFCYSKIIFLRKQISNTLAVKARSGDMDQARQVQKGVQYGHAVRSASSETNTRR